MAFDVQPQTSTSMSASASASASSLTRAPAQPSYVFRGHTAQIHHVHLMHRNTCLVTGDADGWVVYWRLESKRPVAVWKAHDAAILGTAEWGPDNLITHGRDHSLRIWQLTSVDGCTLSTVLPADGSATHRPKPWLLHSLPVNTLNFCAFSMTYEQNALDVRQHTPSNKVYTPSTRSSEPILVAVPARDDKKIEIYRFPDEKLAFVVPRVDPIDTGMVMAVRLIHHSPSSNTLVIAGYEGGFTAVHLLPRNPGATRKSIPKLAQLIYLSQPHSQPILGLDVSPDSTKYYTSSADAIIAAHRIPELPLDINLQELPEEELVTSSPATDFSVQPPNFPSSPSISGQAIDSASIDNPDQKVDSSDAYQDQRDSKAKSAKSDLTAKDDINSREADASTTLLDFSQKDVTTPTDISPLSFSKQPIPAPQSSSSSPKPAGLSSLLSSTASQSKLKPSPPPLPTITAPQLAFKVIDTKHSGQQSLRIRSDGRLLVTGGWDSRVRIYSAKTLKEVAVLKWHKEGVYAVDFGEILDAKDDNRQTDTRTAEYAQASTEDNEKVTKRETGLGRLQRQREEQMQIKHWVVAGAKDGKVSLWEVF